MECQLCGKKIEGEAATFCSPEHRKSWHQRQYRKRNKEKINAYKRAYWKNRKRVTGYFERVLKPRFLKENGECLKCGSTEDLQVHHIKPLGKGGDNRTGNLMTLCRKHHREFEKVTWTFFEN